MRKRRVIIYDDEPAVLNVLRSFFEHLKYEVVPYSSPVICPIYGEHAPCQNLNPCADIILTDLRMPKGNGIDLLRSQVSKGCRLTPLNKAVMTGSAEAKTMQAVRELGCAFFQKPIRFDALESWVIKCEERMDLSTPLGIKRREPRFSCYANTSCRLASFEELCSGVAVNRSSSGVCLKIDRPLEPEQVTVLDTDIPLASYQAMVRWVQDTGDGEYLVGMSCY